MRTQTLLVVASIPAALAGAAMLGGQIDLTASASREFWQLRAFAALGNGPVTSLLAGLAFLLPLLLTALVVSRGWAVVFARMRGRVPDPSWLMHAWLFALMLPATTSPIYAALGLSFGLVFGCHVFGGDGRYIVTPAALGLVFLDVAYPQLFGAGQWVPGQAQMSSWAALHAAASGGEPSPDLLGLFVGREAGALGTVSEAACIVGLAVLIWRRAVAYSVVAGAVAAVVVAAALFGTVGGLAHLVSGNVVFALVFVAADPTLRPATGAGRWLFGIVFGALVVILRMADPAGPEGTWHALLLASLVVPLLDHIAARVQAGRSSQPSGAERHP